jgi:hypothetical protein
VYNCQQMKSEIARQISSFSETVKEKVKSANPLSYDKIAGLYATHVETQLKRILAGRLYPQRTYRGLDPVYMRDLKGTILRSGDRGRYDWYFHPVIPEFHGKPYVFQIEGSGQDYFYGDSCHGETLPCSDNYDLKPRNYLLTEFPVPAFQNVMWEWPASSISLLVDSWGVEEYTRLSGSAEVVSFIGGDTESRKSQFTAMQFSPQAKFI